MKKDWSRHVAVVAGGSGGIGSKVCQQLKGLGARVVSIHHTRPYPSSRGDVHLQADLTSVSEWTRITRILRGRFDHIDSFIHCTGILTPGTVLSLSHSQIRAMLDANLLSFIYGCQSLLPVMRRQGFGHLLTVGSLGGILPMPYEAIYSASKFALRGFCLSLNEELRGLHIHTSVVSVGPVETHMLNEEALDPDSRITFITKPVSADRVAAAVTQLLLRPKPEIVLPFSAGLMSRILAFTPRLFGFLYRLLGPYGDWRRMRYVTEHRLWSKLGKDSL